MGKRRGQEEIVGFTLLVVIVAIVALILLMIASRSENKGEKTSAEVEQFLESMLQTTTDCSLNDGNYATLGELLVSCHAGPGEKCENNREVCSTLNESVRKIVMSSWKVGNYSLKGYQLEMAYNPRGTKEEKREQFMLVVEGVCGREYVGDSYALPEKKTKGTIRTYMKLCY